MKLTVVKHVRFDAVNNTSHMQMQIDLHLGPKRSHELYMVESDIMHKLHANLV